MSEFAEDEAAACVLKRGPLFSAALMTIVMGLAADRLIALAPGKGVPQHQFLVTAFGAFVAVEYGVACRIRTRVHEVVLVVGAFFLVGVPATAGYRLKGLVGNLRAVRLCRLQQLLGRFPFNERPFRYKSRPIQDGGRATRSSAASAAKRGLFEHGMPPSWIGRDL